MGPESVILKVQRASHAKDLPLPRYMTDGAVGMDLFAAVEDTLSILPGETALVTTGLQVAVPDGYELQVRPRSGLAARQGIGILNSPGTIDPDYRGEIKVVIINMGKEPFLVRRSDRIAQMILCPIPRMILEETAIMTPTVRNDGGFGHTG